VSPIDPSLAPLFAPRAVAVIGASRDPSKVGGSVLANLRSAGFPGRVIPVNARAEAAQGLPAVHSVLDVEGPVDLAVLTVPAPAVLPALKECAQKGVGVAVVISAGFRETGSAGREREDELRAWLASRPLRLLGPNCLGWIRPSGRLNVTFAPGMPLPGSIAFVSHSGALAVAILDWARDRGLGFSVFASLGNQADLTESDVLEAVTGDAETRVIVGYVEGVADGRRFLDALRRAAAAKPVVLLKAGRSAEGARAVTSHTGALAGSDEAFDAAVRQSGAVRAGTVEELFDLARGLATQPLPRGRRVLIVTNGGGLGIVAADAAHAHGLEVRPLDGLARQRLQAALPVTASVANPVDLVGDAEAARYGDALDAAGSESADAAVVILTAQAVTDSLAVARTVLGVTRDWPIPVVASFVGGARVAPGVRALEEAGLPCYPFPERAVAALGGMVLVAERRRRGADLLAPAPSPDEVEALASGLGGGVVGMLDLAPLLRAHGISVVPSELAPTPREAGPIAERIGFPVALKLVSPDITHKTEVGGVRLGLRAAADVVAAAEEMLVRACAARPGARIHGILVQRMVEGGRELLMGMVRDPQFGPMVVVGFGGIYVEVLKDTATRLAPFSPTEARAMLDELRMAPVLRGVRGESPVNLDALADAISRFSRLAADLSELDELEVNPLIAGPHDAVAVDARARRGATRQRRN
jgi:acetyltransferase